MVDTLRQTVWSSWAIALGLAMMALATMAQPAHAGVTFVPHRAVYEISLVSSASGSGVSEMTGRMVYELTGSQCEGFTQNMRFVTRSSNQEGIETTNDLRTSSWEEAGGKRLRFSSTQYQNDAIIEASQGDAARQKGAKGEDETRVELARPAKKRIALPGDVYFPMQHAAALIEAARTGKTLVTANIYDGSEKGERYYATTAIIGKKLEHAATPDTVSNKIAANLAGVVAWPMSISYFETGKDHEDAPPAYELSFNYFENGITKDLKIDYGEFAIKGELTQLDLLPASKCR
ncbi:MAG TPA: cell envelope integrity EipB family protein [Hyphomicrobium sp.]|nr:cell envelope integrity EipB family protein [Hyphomicrobium sp.]